MALSSSGFFLRHVFWRCLRNLVPGTLWSRLYSIRERTLSWLFIRNLEASISTHSPVSPRADSVVRGDARKLEDLWSEHNAVGKRESGYGPVYAEILGDLPRVENVLELGVLGGAPTALGRNSGLKRPFTGSILTLTQLSMMGRLRLMSPTSCTLKTWLPLPRKCRAFSN